MCILLLLSSSVRGESATLISFLCWQLITFYVGSSWGAESKVKLCRTGGNRVARERVVVAAEEHCSLAAPISALLVSELCYFAANASGRSGVPSSRLTIGRPVEGETELHEGLRAA